jgi:hypothetical protein
MKLRIVLYCLLGGLPMAIAAMGAGHFAWFLLSGIVMAAAFVPVALFGPPGVLRQFGVIAPVFVIVTSVCTWSEALIFVPSQRQNAAGSLIGILVMYLVVGVVLAGLARGLKLTKPLTGAPERRSLASALAMIAISGIAYVLFYLVTGGITYQFFTRVYYPEAVQIANSFGLWFWVIEFTRGVLMTLAVLPAIYTLRMPRWQTAIAVGILIWVAGGLAPLLIPNALLGTRQRIIHIVEILTQNAPLGIAAVLLLRPRSAASPAALPKTAAASL